VNTVAERYALAVFELGVEDGQLPQVTSQIRSLAQTYASSDELRGVLDNPLIDDQRRERILTDISTRLGLGRLAVNTIRLLVRRHRLGLLPEISRALDQLADEKAGLLRATVTSAIPLSESYRHRLTGELEQLTKRKVVLEARLDPTLIAGLVTRIGDNTIDGSIKGRLEDLERQLLRP
jgi:F-type H+-transporting ATPase subunit delta